MSVAKKAFKGSVIITMGEAIGQICGLLRNIVLARVLTKADFGISAMIGMTISIFEIGGRLSIEQLVVQSKDGDQPHFAAGAHLVQASLGLLSTVLILLAAHPMAKYFGVPDAAWALQVLSVIPLLRALSNLDVFRMNRELHFGPGVMIDLIPQIVTTIAVWPLSLIWNSYVVLVWIFLGKQLASTLASHFVAKRSYRWAYDPEVINSILTFGWPMLINGLLLFGIMQGDRFAVGVRYSATELGVYSIAGTLALVPAATLLRLSGGILLPLMSSARDDTKLFLRRLGTTSEIMALFSGVYAMVMILAGGPLVLIIFGSKYNDSGALTAWMGLSQALRLLRNVPTIAAMSKGDTKNLMFSNLLRLIGLALAFPIAKAGGSLASIAACAAIGEGLALLGSFWRFTRYHSVPASAYLRAMLLAGVFIALSALLSWLGLSAMKPWISLGVTTVLVLLFAGLHLAIFSDSRRLLLARIVPLLQARFKPGPQAA